MYGMDCQLIVCMLVVLMCLKNRQVSRKGGLHLE